MRGNTHNGGTRIVTVLAATAAGVLGGCGDDDGSAVTGSIPGRPSTATASTTASDVEPWVAYTIVSPTDEPEGVALVHPDGSDDHQILAELPYPALNPDWSPDGTRLALQVYSQDNIWIANADGSAPEVAAPCTASCAEITDPDWSPSGEQLLVIRFDDGPERGTTLPEPTSATVELIDLRNGERRDIIQSSFPEQLRDPSWSPDGKSYAVTVRRFDDDGEQTGSAIAIGGLDGSPLKVLTPFDQRAGPANWHPQDDILVYSAGDEASNVFTIRADGSDLQAVTEFEPDGTRAEAALWAPDGERIIFTAVHDPAEVDQGAPYLTMASIKPDGTGLERMPLAGRNGYHYTLQPTPG